MFALGGWGPTLSGANEPEQLSGVVASHDAFIILGIEPLLGRGFRPEEDAANTELVVVLAHSLWQRRFRGSPDVLGVTLTLDGQPATVIGVMLPELDFPIVSKPEIFAPLQIDRSNSCGLGCVTLRVIACLKEVGSLDVAHSDIARSPRGSIRNIQKRISALE